MMKPLSFFFTISLFFGSIPSLLAQTETMPGPLFLKKGDLVVRGLQGGGLREALKALVAGPTGMERARGLETALPKGLKLLRLNLEGGKAKLLFGSRFLALFYEKGSQDLDLELGLEQIIKTTLRSSRATSVEIRVLDSKGRERSLDRLWEDFATSGKPVLPKLGNQKTQGSSSPTSAGGALSGKTIFISPGHGYYRHSTLGWTTQRPKIGGLIEDIHTNEITMRYLIPALKNMGARVISARERGEITKELILDNDQGATVYKENGLWFSSSSSGYNGGTYRFTGTSAKESARAVWTFKVPKSGRYSVQVFYRAGGNRSSAARYVVRHSGGVSETLVDQSRDDRRWVHLGKFWFEGGLAYSVGLSNQAPSGKVVIADAIRVGAGMGSIVRQGTKSGKPRWQECSRYWIQYVGAPSYVYDTTSSSDRTDDVTARPTYAEWQGADAYLSLHTNAGGGSGTSSYIHNTHPTSGSKSLQASVQAQIVGDIRQSYDSTWINRGKFSANFGELRILKSMPGVLVELAFHDKDKSRDHNALHDPKFRKIAGKAYARGVMRFFKPFAAFPPETPKAIRVTQDGQGGLRVAWEPVTGATLYSIETSKDGKGFIEAAQTSGTSWATGPLPHGSMLSFRVRARNASGQSFATEVLCAGTSHDRRAQVLLVQGFDRLGKFVKGPENTMDYLRLHGEAIRWGQNFSLGFDAASNEAVSLGRVVLSQYRAVDWALGEESTRDESFSSREQSLVQLYLGGGGRLLVSGSEIAWDLDRKGSSADKAFIHNVLGVRYGRDDANSYNIRALNTSIFQGLPNGTFDNGTGGTYNVDYPDVLLPNDNNSKAALYYGFALDIAAIVRIQGKARVVFMGFPLETVTSAGLRASLMQRSLRFLLEDRSLEAPETISLGNTGSLAVSFPGKKGQLYLLAASLSTNPGIPLGSVGSLPLQADLLFSLSLGQSNGLFNNFAGFLNASGKAAPSIAVPNLVSLRGQSFFVSGLVFNTNFGVDGLMPYYRVRL
jgi:N-acetylmuramoyl-L-alanine amidase